MNESLLQHPEPIASDVSNEALLNAIADVETLGKADRDHCIGDRGAAVGRYQLHKSYVDDADRFACPSNWRYDQTLQKFVCKDESKRLFTYESRTNPVISREIVLVYLSKYAKIYEQKMNQKPTFEVLVRMHNGGGGRGWCNPRTVPYYEKALKYLV